MNTNGTKSARVNRAKKEWSLAMKEWEEANLVCAKSVRVLERNFFVLRKKTLVLELSYMRLKEARRAKKTNGRW